MIKYLFSDVEHDIFNLLKSKPPNKIWFNVIQYVFDYGDYYVRLEVRSTTDPSNYSITNTYESTIETAVVNDVFVPCELSVQLCENENIVNIYVVRTLIIHSIRKASIDDKLTINNILNSISHREENTLNKYMDEINEISSDLLFNPNSVLPDDINKESTNLVDVGIFICLNNRYIKAFIEDNNDDFSNFEERYIFDDINFAEIEEKYELIKLE